MKRHGYLILWVVAAGLVAAGQVLAQGAPAAGTNTGGAAVGEEPAPAKTVKETTKEAATTVPDYSKALNKELTPGEKKPGTTEGTPQTATLPPSRLYRPYVTPAAQGQQHVKDILERYSPSNSNYSQSQKSYELLQQQMQRRQLETGLNARMGTIATSNPDLYKQQLTQEVSAVLGDRTGISGTADASLSTLLAVDKNTNPSPTLYPERGQQFAGGTGASSGVTGSGAGLNQATRINAGLGNAYDFRRFQGLQNVDANRYAGYSSYLSREYGVNGLNQAYTVPRAYQYSQMNQDIQYLRQSYGINIDPNRVTYTDLYKLRTSRPPR